MSERKNPDLTPEERRIQAALRDMGEVEPEAGLQERLRRAFVSGDLAPSESGPGEEVPAGGGFRGWWTLAAAAAIMVAAFMVFRPSVPQEWAVVNASGGSSVEAPGDQGGRVHPTGDQGVDLQLGRVMILGLGAGSEVVVPGVDPGDPPVYEAQVLGGELLVRTGPDFRGRKLRVMTTEGWVELTGTTVAINKMPDVTCICVLEGTAMIGMNQEDLEPVSPGMRKVMFADGRPPEVIPIMSEHEDHMVDFEARTGFD